MERTKILIVDDEPKNIQLVMSFLRGIDDYNVIFSTGAVDALEKIDLSKNDPSKQFDLILLDVVMPQMNGFDMCKKLKSDDLTKDIPIIFLTGKTENEYIIKGFEVGGADYIIKPINARELLARVKANIDSKKFNDHLKSVADEKTKIAYQLSKLAALGEMIGNISHQWRQPLSTISVIASGMKVKNMIGELDDEYIDESADVIVDTCNYLSHTIDDFKNFIKGDKIITDFNISDIVKKTNNIMRSSLKNHFIELIEDLDTTLYTKGSPNELIQALINIINNAKDAFEQNNIQNRYLFVTLTKKNNNAVVRIRDNAGGIPLDILPRIFESYFTTKEDGKGTGIGLYMTQEIIANTFKGSIKVKNVQYEHGSEIYDGAEFEIAVPIVEKG